MSLFFNILEAIAELDSPIPDESKPQKRTRSSATTTKRKPASRRQARYAEDDLECWTSDSDGNGSSMGHSSHGRSRRNNTNYDPNVITIDCDDGYYFGANPEVRIERNLTTAPSCEAADNAALQVKVRIDNKIETYDLRKVSE